MEWQKRDCPIKMEVVAYGAGWEDITLDICGKHHWWSVSGCSGDGFGALVESLYALYPYQTYDQAEEHWLSECDEYVAVNNGHDVTYRPREDNDSAYVSLPKSAAFLWDLEGRNVNWKITRESGYSKDFKLTIEIKEGDEDESSMSRYEVLYSDLCYAVGKALTDVVKKHGFAGFHTSVWECDINIRHLCFLKACGMGKPDVLQPVESNEKGAGAISSFIDELELLIFDM